MLPPAVAAQPEPTALLDALLPEKVGAGRLAPVLALAGLLEGDEPDTDGEGESEAGVLGVPNVPLFPPKAVTIWSSLDRTALC